MRRLVLACALLIACNGPVEETGDPTPVEVAGPELTHVPPTDVFVAGDTLRLEVAATDPDGVLSVQGSWRRIGDAAWNPSALELDGDVYALIVADAPAPGIEYFFRATDGSEYAAVSFAPAEADDEPYRLEVLTQGETLPWSEDFEATADTVYDLGWLEFSYGFPGYTWDVTEAEARDRAAVQHRRGLEETGPMDDWLVTPALDFSGASTAQLSFYEHGVFTSGAQHSVWASTGSPDPEDGDFALVAELDPPAEGDWQRAVAVDLAALAGEQLVYLAFRYEGTYADLWTVDDVAVGPLTSDLRIRDVAWTRFDPGASGDVVITVENVGAVDATNLTVTGAVDAADGTVSAPVALGTLAAGATDTATLQLTVDAGFPDNSWLPIQLTAAADDFTEVRDAEVLVGDATTATLELTTFGEGLLVATVGTGDPESPEVEVEVATRVYGAGTWTLEADLTPHAALLPPGPGLDRWWARIEGSAAGSLDGFAIDSGPDSYVSDDLGAWPAVVETLYFLPRPPSPEVFRSTTTPTPVAPGDQVTWSLTLVNYGPSTIGATTATVSTSDPDVTLYTPGPFDLGTDWAENDSRTLPLAFLALPSQNDSQPIGFEIAVTDTLESFLVEVEVPVPWPLIGLTAVVVDDFLGGNGDGLPDVGESFELAIDLTNSGALDSFGPLVCTLSQTGGAATVTVTDASALFNTIGAGETQSDQGVSLTLDSGNVGDDIDLELVCTDDEGTYVLPFELVVGEPPWRALTTVQDAIGDNQGYDFDFTTADWRVVRGVLELRLISAVPYDSSTLFLEGYLDSAGAPYFDYNLIVQSGVARFRGRDITGYTDLVAPEIIEPDDHTIVLRIPLAPLELVQDQLLIGLGTGYCGSTTYYCDHYPDGWGAPYQGMTQSLWATMAW